MTIKDAISKVVKREDLTEKEMSSVFNSIMSGKATPSQISAFITALHMKGETPQEITGAAKVMRKKALKVKIGVKKGSRTVVLDTCGTGGTGMDTFNISTTVAFVIAGCGVKVAKHGNRASSSRCGSADVLEELGVRLDVPVSVTEKCIKEINVGFIFAPLFHGATKYAVGPRKEIGVRTIFNVLGPLSNPASANCQVMGVYEKDLTVTMTRVLKSLGTKRAYIVHGEDGLDEVTITGKTRITELKSGKIRSYSVSPKDFGIKRSAIKNIQGGSKKMNAKMVLEVLSGKKGPCRDIVLMNSSVALMAASKVSGLKKGVTMAKEAIDSGAALENLKMLVKITNK